MINNKIIFMTLLAAIPLWGMEEDHDYHPSNYIQTLQRIANADTSGLGYRQEGEASWCFADRGYFYTEDMQAPIPPVQNIPRITAEELTRLASSYTIILNPQDQDKAAVCETLIRSYRDNPYVQQLIQKITILDSPAAPAAILYPRCFGKETAQKLADVLWMQFPSEESAGKLMNTAPLGSVIAAAQATLEERRDYPEYFDTSGAYFNKDYSKIRTGKSPYALIRPEVHVRAVQDGYRTYRNAKQNFYKKLTWSTILLGCCTAMNIYMLRTQAWSPLVKNMLLSTQAGVALAWLYNNYGRLREYMHTHTPYVAWFLNLPEHVRNGYFHISQWNEVPQHGIRIHTIFDTVIHPFINKKYLIGTKLYEHLDTQKTYYYDHDTDCLVQEGGEIIEAEAQYSKIINTSVEKASDQGMHEYKLNDPTVGYPTVVHSTKDIFIARIAGTNDDYIIEGKVCTNIQEGTYVYQEEELVRVG